MLDNREMEFINVLKIVAPGTPLREGLENVLKAKTGALIMVGDQKEVMGIIDGGFFINSEYSPSYLYELAKMDGAIVLSSDLKKYSMQTHSLYQIRRLKLLRLVQGTGLQIELQNRQGIL